MTDPLLDALQAAQTPQQKAALIAESVLNTLPPEVALVARRCVIFHWFDQALVTGLNPEAAADSNESRFAQITALPFVEPVSAGFAFHQLTRTGLLALYQTDRSELLSHAAGLAAPLLAARQQDHNALAEAFFCWLITGEHDQATSLLDDLILWAARHDQWPFLQSLFEIQAEAEAFSFIRPLVRSALHWFYRGNTYYNLTNYEQALSDYTRAIELDPNYATAYYNMACSYALQGQIDAALPPLTRALELNPSHYLELTVIDSDFDAIRTDPRFQALLAKFRPPDEDTP
jgi:tetratricopeptide (TPR) repeat protein